MADIPFARLRVPKAHRSKVGPDAPRKIRLTIAKGALPMPVVEQVGLAFVLLQDEDRESAEAANETLQAVPTDKLLGTVIGAGTHPMLLEYYAGTRGADQVLARAIYRLRDANDRTAILIAEQAQRRKLATGSGASAMAWVVGPNKISR